MKIVGALLLFGFWLMLSTSLSVGHVITGAVVAGLIMWVKPLRPRTTRRTASLVSALAYIPWLAVKVVKSALHVSKLILSPSLPISPRMIQHKTELKSDGELVVLGNSITLTPGTITVEVSPGELTVHAIDEASMMDLSAGVFDDRISRMYNGGGSAE
jgi:multicomponent Na+:H+ antiporter subunit E